MVTGKTGPVLYAGDVGSDVVWQRHAHQLLDRFISDGNGESGPESLYWLQHQHLCTIAIIMTTPPSLDEAVLATFINQ